MVQGKLNEAYEAFSEAFTILQQVRLWVLLKQMFSSDLDLSGIVLVKIKTGTLS
jgi:hypothetical protein